MRFPITFVLLSALGVQTAYAWTDALKGFEISGAGGASWLNTDDTHVVVSSVETDKDKVDSTSVGGTWKAGIGYYLLEQQLKQRQYFNRLLLELNVYGASNDLNGDVWQFELPQFNNYTFDATLSSIRLMLDFKPTITTWNRFSPYAIVGIGATWNTASYDEKAVAGIDPASALSLSDQTQTQLAWDLGAGVNVTLTDQVSLTAEYIYAFLGDAEPEKTSAIDQAPSFSYQIQSLLFGLSVKF